MQLMATSLVIIVCTQRVHKWFIVTELQEIFNDNTITLYIYKL